MFCIQTGQIFAALDRMQESCVNTYKCYYNKCVTFVYRPKLILQNVLKNVWLLKESRQRAAVIENTETFWESAGTQRVCQWADLHSWTLYDTDGTSACMQKPSLQSNGPIVLNVKGGAMIEPGCPCKSKIWCEEGTSTQRFKSSAVFYTFCSWISLNGGSRKTIDMAASLAAPCTELLEIGGWGFRDGYPSLLHLPPLWRLDPAPCTTSMRISGLRPQLRDISLSMPRVGTEKK